MRAEAYLGATCAVGMPGGGKTYYLAEKGAAALARGERVFSNEGFSLVGSEVYKDFEEFLQIDARCSANDHLKQEHLRSDVCPDGHRFIPVTVLLDEAPIFYNARKWGEFPDAAIYKFTQVRKDGIRLYYSAMDEAMVDATLRRITFFYVHSRQVSRVFPRWLQRAVYPPQERRRANGRPMSRSNVWVKDSIASLYDTFAKVQPPPKVRAALEAAGVMIPATAEERAALEAAGSCRCPVADARPQGGPRVSGVPEAAHDPDPVLGRTEWAGSWAVGEGVPAAGQAARMP